MDLTHWVLVFFSSVIVSFLIWVTRASHIQLAVRQGLEHAVQSAHTTPTPRIAGLSILVGFLMTVFLVQGEAKTTMLLLGAAALPLFVAGFLEDLGFGVSPGRRLLAALISAGLAVALLQAWLDRIDMPVVDGAFLYAPVAITSTILICATIANAFNLIDGLNGLAGSISILSGLGLAAVATQAGVHDVQYFAYALTASIAGFLVLNFPHGRVFLGDAGAYCTGFLLSWFAILLSNSTQDLTPWSLVLILFWPIMDTFLAIYRRRKTGKAAGLPDRLHMHQLVMRALEISLLGKQRRQLSNPLATLIILPFAAAPVLTGVVLWNDARMAFIAVLAYLILFASTYFLGISIFSNVRRRRVISIENWQSGAGTKAPRLRGGIRLNGKRDSSKLVSSPDQTELSECCQAQSATAGV